MAFYQPRPEIVHALVDSDATQYRPGDILEFHLRFGEAAPAPPLFPDLRRRLEYMTELTTKAREMIGQSRETGHCTMLCFRLAVMTINILSDLQTDLANPDIVPVRLTPILRRLRLAGTRAQAVLDETRREAWSVARERWFVKFIIFSFATLLISAVAAYLIPHQSPFQAIIPVFPYFANVWWGWFDDGVKKKNELLLDSEVTATWCLKTATFLGRILQRNIIPFVEQPATETI